MLRQLKLVSDGTPQNTELLTEDGENLLDKMLCVQLNWNMQPGELGRLHITVDNVATEVIGKQNDQDQD